MAKKKATKKEETVTQEIEVKDIVEAQKIIADLNESGKMNKPSPEECEAAAKEFVDAKEAFENKLFDIGNPDIAVDMYDFVIDFMVNYVQWTKNGWMGVIRMHDEMVAAKINHKDGDAFHVTYQALEFLFFALSNPGGFGLKAAKTIEKVADFYINFYEMTGKVLEEARKEREDTEWLGQKAAAMQQGFYMEREDGTPKPGNGQEVGFKSPTAEDLIKK